MSELSFLIDLLLNHDLPVKTKHVIAERIKEVEVALTSRPTPMQQAWAQPTLPPPAQRQAPSTLALMAKHGDIAPMAAPEMPPIEPVIQIAQTVATAAAMNSRNQAIAESIAGKVDKSTGRPRKF